MMCILYIGSTYNKSIVHYVCQKLLIHSGQPEQSWLCYNDLKSKSYWPSFTNPFSSFCSAQHHKACGLQSLCKNVRNMGLMFTEDTLFAGNLKLLLMFSSSQMFISLQMLQPSVTEWFISTSKHCLLCFLVIQIGKCTCLPAYSSGHLAEGAVVF